MTSVLSVGLAAQTARNPLAEVPVKLPSAASAPKAPLPTASSAKSVQATEDSVGLIRTLQGNYTNKYEQGTPFERPQEFEGKRIEDIQGEGSVDDSAAAADRHRAGAVPGAIPPAPIAGPMEFRDIDEVAKAAAPGS